MNRWTFDQLRLDNKAVLIAGVGDLGRVIARGMAEAGALTVVADASRAAAAAAKKIIQKDGRVCYACKMDIGRSAEIDRAIQFVRKQYGKIDVAVNCVGINIRKPSSQVKESDWDPVLDVNLKGTFFFSQAAARAFMKQKTRGKIIIIASLLGLVGMEERAAYSASKAGLINLVRTLAVEWARDHIYVNTIAPTFIPTALNRHTLMGNFRKKIIERTPLKRLGKPEDLVGTAVLLASDASDFLTGQTIVIDGGWLSG